MVNVISMTIMMIMIMQLIMNMGLKCFNDDVGMSMLKMLMTIITAMKAW